MASSTEVWVSYLWKAKLRFAIATRNGSSAAYWIAGTNLRSMPS